MDIGTLIVSLISGVLGGHGVAKAAPEQDLGGLGNTIAGLLGGSAGGYLLNLLNLFGPAAGAAAATAAGEAAHGFNFAEFLANVASSGAGGAILTYIVGLLKNSAK